MSKSLLDEVRAELLRDPWGQDGLDGVRTEPYEEMKQALKGKNDIVKLHDQFIRKLFMRLMLPSSSS